MNYFNMLKKYDLKITPQRVAIIEDLQSCGHLSIERIYSDLRDKFPSISLATIYKNINTMIEKGLVLEIKIPSEKSVYELAKAEHAHFICDECKRIDDIYLDTKEIVNEVQSFTSCSISSANLIFGGTCSNCA